MTHLIRPRRSVLYLPGSNARAIEKARDLPVDAIILDLEDAVGPDAKELARAQVCDAVKRGGFGKREIVIRINALTTQWGEVDLAAAVAAGPDAILIPKVSKAGDLCAPQGAIGERHIALWAMIETPRAVLDISSIAGAGGKLSCLVVGTNDLLKDLRGKEMPGRANLIAALGLCVAAARAFGLAAIDGVFNDISDMEGFRESCRQGRAFGFDGKSLIHPSQIETCNKLFAPSREELENARKIIAAFERPENDGKGAIAQDGRMIERLHLDAARAIVALGQTIDASSN
ncbi:MAG TPA: CoA ester lyase [Rhizomicrobium sp.]|jgi:citrate lyase subunit beta/citryl-CoA lyase